MTITLNFHAPPQCSNIAISVQEGATQLRCSMNGPLRKLIVQAIQICHICLLSYSRVDTDVLMEVAYSCNFLAVSDSSTCPDIGTS